MPYYPNGTGRDTQAFLRKGDTAPSTAKAHRHGGPVAPRIRPPALLMRRSGDKRTDPPKPYAASGGGRDFYMTSSGKSPHTGHSTFSTVAPATIKPVPMPIRGLPRTYVPNGGGRDSMTFCNVEGGDIIPYVRRETTAPLLLHCAYYTYYARARPPCSPSTSTSLLTNLLQLLLLRARPPPC